MATRYVATTGNNGSTGGPGDPWLTISYAVAQLNAGDLLYIRGGTYTSSNDTIRSGATTVSSGSNYGAGAITISAYPSETVTIQPPDGVAGIQLTGGQSYIIFQDLIVDMINNSTPSVGEDGIYLSTGSNHIRFLRCQAINNSTSGMHFSSSGGDAGYNEVISCYLYNNGRLSEGNSGYGMYLSTNNNLMEGNDVVGNNGYGIHINASAGHGNDNVIRGNLIHENLVHGTIGTGGSTSYGIVASSDGDNLIHDNVIWGNQGGILVYNNSMARVLANTVTANVGHGGGGEGGIDLQYYSHTTPPLVQNNIVYGNVSQITDYGDLASIPTVDLSAAAKNFTTDPLFTNAGTHDYTVQAGSGALVAGLNLYSLGLTYDYAGNARPSSGNWTIGALQDVVATYSVTATDSLRVSLSDLSRLRRRSSASDSLRVAATTNGAAAVFGSSTTKTGQDSLRAGLSEAKAIVVRTKGSESLRVGTAESARVGLRLKAADTLKAVAGHEGATASAIVPGTRLQARSGIARAGATFAGWTAPKVTCTIASAVRTTSVRLEDFQITYRLDRGESECMFKVSGFQPAAGNDVKITYATPDDYLFAGTILQADAVRVQAGEGPMVWTCAARGYVWLMDTYGLVLERYENVAVNTMVAHMLGKYTAGGFRLGYAPQELGTLTMDFEFEPLSQAIDRIARAAGANGASWLVTPHRFVRIFETAPGGDMAAIVNGQAYRDLAYGEDITPARATMFIRGTGARAAATVSPADATVPVSDTAQFVPAEGVIGGTVIHGKSIFTYASVSVGSGPGDLLGCSPRLHDIDEGDAVSVFVQETDAAKLVAIATALGGESSGSLSYYEADDISLAEAQGRAAFGLDQHGQTAKRFRYTTTAADRWLRVGRTVPVSITNPMTVSGTFQVQQYVIEPDGPLVPTAPRLWRHVEASSTVRSFRQALAGLIAAQQQGGSL